jgi:hypothetical protein
MRLTALDPEFIRWEDRDGKTYLPNAEGLADAQGIEFDCPKCRSPGHRIHVAFANRGVLDHHGTRASDGRPTRWQVIGGTGFDDLTLSPSIDCTPSNPDCWHGFITAGEAT